jgi:hypothetical protein
MGGLKGRKALAEGMTPKPAVEPAKKSQRQVAVRSDRRSVARARHGQFFLPGDRVHSRTGFRRYVVHVVHVVHVDTIGRRTAAAGQTASAARFQDSTRASSAMRSSS